MGVPYMGELRLMSFNFPPKGWAECNGQFMPINQNQALFSLLGTMYGGNGQTTFALPDLRGRTPIHVGGGFTQGEKLGEESHTVVQAEMPAHTHQLQASGANADTPVPVGSLLGQSNNTYTTPIAQSTTTLRPDTVTNVGGSQPHQNLSPFLTLNWCISLQGFFPSRN
jgi:microcystin-dependent protein